MSQDPNNAIPDQNNIITQQSNNQQKKVVQIPDANESFAQVELFLWQYGELPQPTDTRKIDIGKALNACHDRIFKAGKEKDMKLMPSPIGVASVMKYLADKFDFES